MKHKAHQPNRNKKKTRKHFQLFFFLFGKCCEFSCYIWWYARLFYVAVWVFVWRAYQWKLIWDGFFIHAMWSVSENRIIITQMPYLLWFSCVPRGKSFIAVELFSLRANVKREIWQTVSEQRDMRLGNCCLHNFQVYMAVLYSVQSSMIINFSRTYIRTNIYRRRMLRKNEEHTKKKKRNRILGIVVEGICFSFMKFFFPIYQVVDTI